MRQRGSTGQRAERAAGDEGVGGDPSGNCFLPLRKATYRRLRGLLDEDPQDKKSILMILESLLLPGTS